MPGIKRHDHTQEAHRNRAVSKWGFMVLIVINAITLGLETSSEAMAAFGPVLVTIDRIIWLSSCWN